MKSKRNASLLVVLFFALLETLCYADYQVDFKKLIGCEWCEPFATDKMDYDPSDLTDTDKMTYVSADFDIKGKGRGSDLNLSFIRYYNNKLNSNSVSGYSWQTNLDVSLQIVSGNYVVRDEKGDEFTFGYSFNPYAGGFFYNISIPNPHTIYFSGNYVIFQKKYGNKYFFNGTTQFLEKIQDRNGNEIIYTRDANNRVTSLTDSSNRTITFTYNAQGKVATATDPMNRVYSFGYDTNNNLITVTNPLNNLTTFEYQCPTDIHNISKIKKPKGNFQGFEYNQDDQLIKISENNIEVWTLSYNKDLGSTQISNMVGLQVIKLKLDNGKKIITTDNFGSETDELDIYGYLTKYTDKLNHITTMIRDDKGNVTSMTNARGNTTTQIFNTLNKVTQMTSPLNLVENFQYDSKGNLLKYINGEGGEWIFSYNVEGAPLTVKDPNQKVTTFEYDSYGNLIKLTSPNGGVREYSFDLVGNLLSEKDVNGKIFNYSYDLLNRKIQVTNPDNSSKSVTYDNNGLISTFTNENGDSIGYTYNGIDKIQTFADEENNITQYSYDPMGRLISFTDSRNYVYSFEYDVRDRLTKKIFPDTSFISYEYNIQSSSKLADNDELCPSLMKDQMGNIFKFFYNELYLQIKIINPLNEEITKEWDELDRLHKIINPKNIPTKFSYNRLHKITEVENILGYKKSFNYDNLGMLISVSDEESNITNYLYNEIYQKTKEINALGQATTFQRDLIGNVTSIIDPKGNPISYQYDSRNRITKNIDAENHTTQYFYDNLNNITKIIRPDSSQVLFEYFKNGLLKKITYPGNKIVLFEYDSNRNLTKMTDWTGETIYSYDNRNQLGEVIKPNGKKIQYQYNLNGIITQLKLLDQADTELYKINYAIDRINRVSGIIDSNNTGVQISYDSVGNRFLETLSNGTTISYSYNEINNLTQIKTVNSFQQNLHQLDYTHDKIGNIFTETDETGFQKIYSYDSIYQLTGVNYTNGEFINYTYDDAGNRLTQNKNGIITNSTYNNLNQLIQTNETGITTQYAYNSNGSLIQTFNPNQTVNYQYNFMNKVESITKTGVENIMLTMNYNGVGHRIEKNYSDGKSYSYLYTGNNILEETSNQYTSEVAYYLMGGIDEVFARTINNSPEFYLKDNLNSLRKVIDNTQSIINSINYEPFGAIRSGNSGNHNYLFTGREKDFEDVYYCRARTFSPISGRFQQNDPIGVYGGLNIYNYVSNNPVKIKDPLGLCPGSEENWKKRLKGKWEDLNDVYDEMKDLFDPFSDEKGWDLDGYYDDNWSAKWDVDIDWNFDWNDGSPSVDPQIDSVEVEIKIKF